MGLHIENDSELHWLQREDRPLHWPIIAAMGLKRRHNMHRAFHILDPTIPIQYLRDWNPWIYIFGRILVIIGFLADILLSTSVWRGL